MKRSSQKETDSKLQYKLYFQYFQEQDAPLLIIENKSKIIQYNEAAKILFNLEKPESIDYSLNNLIEGSQSYKTKLFSHDPSFFIDINHQKHLLKNIHYIEDNENSFHILKFWSRTEKQAFFDSLLTAEESSNDKPVLILDEHNVIFSNKKFHQTWNRRSRDRSTEDIINNVLGLKLPESNSSLYHILQEETPQTYEVESPDSTQYKIKISSPKVSIENSVDLLKFSFLKSSSSESDLSLLQDVINSKVQKGHDLPVQIKNIIEYFPLPVFIIDKNHEVTHWNKYCEKVTGYSKESLLGRPSKEIPFNTTSQPLLADLIVEGYSYDKIQQQYNNAVYHDELNGKGYILERYVPSMKGNKKWFLIKSVPFEHNNKKHALQIATEITSQKNREQDIQAKLTRYKYLYSMLKRLIDTLPDMVWAKDLDKKYIFVNEAICNNLLNAKSTQEPIGKSDLYFAQRERKKHPEEQHWHDFGEICIDSDEIVMRTQSEGRFEEFGHIKGDFKYLDVYKSPFYNEEGEMIGTVGFARDITKQKKLEKEKNSAQDKLIQTDEKYKVVFENKGVANLLIEKESLKIILVNKQFTILTHYKKDDIEKNYFLEDIFPETFIQKIKNTSKEFFKKELQIRNNKDQKKNLIAYVSELPLSQKYIISLFDITKRKKAEEKLKKNEIRYRKLFENMGNGAIVLDPNKDGEIFTIKDFNKSAERILNIKKSNVIGKSLSNILNFNENAISIESFRKVYQTGQAFQTSVNYYQDNKCSGYHKHYIYKLPTGEIISIFDDVSLQVQSERQLQKQRQELQDLSSQLIDNQENYRKSLARELHDEFGQELTAVAINLEKIQNRISDQCLNETIEQSKEIIDSTEEKIRNLSLTLRPSILDDLGLKAAIKWYIDKFNNQFGFNVKLQLKAEVQDFSSKIKINLFRIFQESLTNAMRHSKADTVIIKTRLKDNVYCLIIEDDGVGFDSGKLIEESDNKSNYVGLLGMRERARVLGGQFHYDTAPGEGTKVKIELPMESD